MDLDLDQFIRQCPPPGMNEDVIKVCTGGLQGECIEARGVCCVWIYMHKRNVLRLRLVDR